MKDFIITASGQSLITRMIAGTSMATFTKIKTSDHEYTADALVKLTDLDDVKQEVDISKVTRTDTSTVEVVATMENKGLTDGYYVKVLGLYAKDSVNQTEILFGVSTETETPDYMPAFGGKTASAITYRLNIKVDVADRVEIVINPVATATIEQVENVERIINMHEQTDACSETGVHGIRYFDKVLQIRNNKGEWDKVKTGGASIPPKIVTNITTKGSDSKVIISWNDPEDSVIDGIALATWAGTKLIMKKGSAPADEEDGTLVVNNTVRNQYAVNGYEISGLENNQTYYFYFIPYTTDDVCGYSDDNRATATPAKVTLDDVTDISASTADGTITVNWTNPAQTKTQDDVTATWVKTTVVVKAGSPPVSETDGTAYISTDYSEGTHTFTMENGEDYYIAFFVESDLGSVKKTAHETAVPMYATLLITTEEATLYGKTVTASYGDSQSIETTFSSDGKATLKVPYIGEVSLSSTDGNETTTSEITIEKWITYTEEMSFLKIVTFADGTDKEICKMIEAHYADKINIADYWAVGDIRTVHLSAMEAIGVGESHREQDVQFVIADFEHDDLTIEINGHAKAAVTLSQKDVLLNINSQAETGYMEEKSDTYNEGWSVCKRRTWCNDIYYNALPSILKNCVKEVNKDFRAFKGNGYLESATVIKNVDDKVFLPSVKEVYKTTAYSENTSGTTYQYYNLSKENTPKSINYWARDVSSKTSGFGGGTINQWYYRIDNSFAEGVQGSTYGIAPCFCL